MATIECLNLLPCAPRLRPSYPPLGVGNDESRTIDETPRSVALSNQEVGARAHGRLGSDIGCEPEVIRRAQMGDAMAWETLVRWNAAWITRACGRWERSRTRAEDLTQDVFLRVFQNLHSYRGELAGFRVWLRRITRNLMIDDCRRHRMERCTVSYDSASEQTQRAARSAASGETSPEARLEKRERRAALRRALRGLGPDLREAIILRDVRGLTYQEISQLLEIPAGTAKSRVNRGRIKLVRMMRRHTAVGLPSFDPDVSAVA